MAKKPRYEGDWSTVDCTCDILNKKQRTFDYLMYMLDRTSQMFEYMGLPETIPVEMLELFLQINGHVSFSEHEGNFYVLPGNPGGAPDPYYRATFYVVANPGLGISKTMRILNHLPPFSQQDYQGECVMIKNDSRMQGLFPLFSSYATQLVENEISIRSAQINSRQNTFISASTDSEIASANAYIKGIEEGKLSTVAEKPFLEGIKVQSVGVQSSNAIIQLIELQQYLKASWYNEIGLNSSFNMKREYLSAEEIRSSTDVLLPLVDDMLERRKEAFEFINKQWGLNITVEKSSAWMNKQNDADELGDAGDNGGEEESTVDRTDPS